MVELSDLERNALYEALRNPRSLTVGLRNQLDHLRVKDRKLTGSGLITTFEVLPDDFKSDVGDFEISDIEGSSENLRNGFGCVVFIRDGQISVLECFAYDEVWPSNLGTFTLRSTLH